MRSSLFLVTLCATAFANACPISDTQQPMSSEQSQTAKVMSEAMDNLANTWANYNNQVQSLRRACILGTTNSPIAVIAFMQDPLEGQKIKPDFNEWSMQQVEDVSAIYSNAYASLKTYAESLGPITSTEQAILTLDRISEQAQKVKSAVNAYT